MTRSQFEKSVITEIRAMMQRNSQQGETPQGNDDWSDMAAAVQVCSAGEWPEDHGGNWTPDRIEANYAFSAWLDQQGDSIVPSSFSEWLGSEDSIFIE